MSSNISYEKKLNEMQKYLPFLRKIIEKLKINNNNADDHPRKGQLQKMEMLHNLLTSQEKKLKIDTLLKCEGVLIKMHSKMEKSNFFQNNAQNSTTRLSNRDANVSSKLTPVSISDDIIDITGPSSPPASPSTQRTVTMLPVEIPTERCCEVNVLENIPKLKRNEQNLSSHKKTQPHQNLKHDHESHNFSSSIKSRDKSSDNKSSDKTSFKTSTESVNHEHRSSNWNAKVDSTRTATLAASPIPTFITSGPTRSPTYCKSDLPFSRNREYNEAPRQKELPSHSPHQHQEDFRKHLQPTAHSHGRTIYSPEESWNEIYSKKTSNNHISSPRHIPVIDLAFDSPRDQNYNKTYNKIIYQFKKPNIDCVDVERSAEKLRKEHFRDEKLREEKNVVFSRLGAKVVTTQPFENFSINVKNDRLKPASTKSSSSSKHASPLPVPSKKVSQPPLADVLKSPPLSAHDISKLLDETVSGAVEPTFTSIVGIGTRRPPKPPIDAEAKPDSPVSSLDMVRKKFALITKNSPQYSESPASPPPQHNNVSVSPQTSERIALKYHPHPRVERIDAFSASSPSESSDTSSPHIRNDPRRIVPKIVPPPIPAAPFNVLPSINLCDPRLKKATLPQTQSNKNIPSLLSLPIPPPISSFNATVKTKVTTDFRKQHDAAPPSSKYPAAIIRDQAYKHVTPNFIPTPNVNVIKQIPERKYSSEENWDSDSETTPTTIKALLPAPVVSPAPVNKVTDRPIVQKNTWQTAQTTSKGYSSEENWDSDPEPVAVSTKSTPIASNAGAPKKSSVPEGQSPSTFAVIDPRLSRGNAPAQQTFTPRTHDYNDDVGRSPQTFASVGHPVIGTIKPHHPPPTNSNCTRFSAVLNDQKERLKYLESKKQKQTVQPPRTYAEFREAKARAAAEEAAARNAVATSELNETSQTKEVPKQQLNLSRESSIKSESEKKKAGAKPKDFKVKDASILPKKTAAPPDTNLDKLYRGSSFSSGSNLVKTRTNFKIPKKHVEKELPKDNVNAEKSVNELKIPNLQDTTQVSTITTFSKTKNVEHKEMKKDDQTPTIAKTNKKQEFPPKTKNKVAKKVEIENNTLNVEESKEKQDNENKTKNSDKQIVKENVNTLDTQVDAKKDSMSEITEKHDSKITDHEKKPSLEIESPDIGSAAGTADEHQHDNVTACPDVDEMHASSTEVVQSKLFSKTERQNIARDLKICNNDPRLNFLQKSPPLSSDIPFQPQRILRRRCTMISYGSAPEVDKDKILCANALLFEDLHDQEKLQRKADEIKKQATRRSKNLAEMFQKTDDNCTVSTQNIISGKRRTRTTVNFNEVKQTLAVFKHKKPATETKKETKEEEEIKPLNTTPKAGVGAAKKSTKKTAQNRIVTEDQSCAVSSTTSQSEEAPSCSSKVTKKKISMNAAPADNEPSSSAKSSNPTPTPILDEEQRKQEFLEGFLRDLKNPNSNQEFILGLLSQILSHEKFQRVKHVLETKADDESTEQIVEDAEEHDDIEADTADVVTQEEAQNKTFGESKNFTGKTKASRRKTIKKKRTNELDRLNLDIRDMFISEGVITATGRRMCTLAAVAEAKNIPDSVTNKKQTKKPAQEPARLTENNEIKHTPLRIRKSKVVISPINFKLLRKSKVVTNESSSNISDNTSLNSDENDEKVGKNKKKLSIKMESGITTEDADTPPRRKMPVLKPNTPIKLLEEEQQLEAIEEKLKPKNNGVGGHKRKLNKRKLTLKTKPCPKSKKQAHVLNSSASESDSADDSEDDIQLAHLRKRIKSINSVHDTETETELKTKTQKKQNIRPDIINTNLNWHSLSKYANWCIICDNKVQYLALHYKQQHNNSENYASRMAPTILQQYKQGKLSAPIFGIHRKSLTYWFYRCPFCLVHNRNMTRSWLEHFTIHTGEYMFECSKCHKGANKQMAIDKHIKQACQGAKLVRRDYQTNNKLIKAHVCHMCNFLQLNRSSLERHFIEQHGCDPDNVTVLGYSINLMNCEGVEVVSNQKANELEAAAIEKYTQESVVSIDDDDDKGEEEEEEISSLATSNPSTIETKRVTRKNKSHTEVATKKECEEVEETSHSLETPPSSETENVTITEEVSAIAHKLSKPHTKEPEVKEPEVNETEVKEPEVKEPEVKETAVNAKEINLSNVETVASRLSRDCVTIDADTEAERVAKFIADVQDDVLAAAAKAESEEKAREAALCSNIFMPTARSNTDSPTIDCLTQSLRTIEQAEEILQQQQQTTFTAATAPSKDTTTNNAGSQSTNSPIMSMAERLSQRFKDIQVRVVAKTRSAEPVEQPPNVNEEIQSAQSIQPASANTSYSDTASTSGGNLIIAEDDEDIEAAHNVAAQQQEEDAEDDGNWEDIEISETAPSATSSNVSAASSSMNNNKEKHKKKKIYQSLNRLYASLNKKNTNNSKTKKNTVITTSSNKKQQQQQPARNQLVELSKSNDTAFINLPTSQASTASARALISNLQDLLPDSPCNDPMELVPELAPVEPLQDLNDISAILEANFNAIDAQNILQQMDINVPADSICINAEGQQQSIQDALEFVTEQQQQDVQANLSASTYLQFSEVTPIATLQTVINRVQNLGFLKTADGGTKFYCLTDNCSFMFSNEAFGLESHYMNEHSQLNWNGFCYTCNQQVNQLLTVVDSPEVFSISEEMQHMLKCHVDVNENSAEQDDEEPSSSTKVDSMPRIKLRRLTGDILSSTPTQALTPEQSTDCSYDITNMTLSDLLRAEQRPVNIKPNHQTEPQHVNADAAQNEQEAMPLFKNIGNEFTITAVASVGTAIAAPLSTDNTASQCQLQIASVRSLNTDAQPAEPAVNPEPDYTLTLPKISNVCSLNLRATSQKTNTTAAMIWQQQIENDRESSKPTDDSNEVSSILENASTNRGEPTDKIGELLADVLRDDSPTLVAETLPTSTSTSGEFLITQTVSAQYDDTAFNGADAVPQLGFNISIAPNRTVLESGINNNTIEQVATVRVQFKCMGNACKYQTRVPIAMSEHLRFHERRNFSTQRDYLRCSLCEHLSDDVNEYIQHAETQHPMQLGYTSPSSANNNGTPTPCELTQKIQSIFKDSANNRANSKGAVDNNTPSSSENAKEVPFKQQLKQTIKEMVEPTGLPESKVYRCVIEGCKTSLTEMSFHTHLVFHLGTLGTLNVNNYDYKCPHCAAIYHRPTGIKAHLKSHARHNYFCFICMATAANNGQILKHFCEKHWKVATINTVPLLIAPSSATNEERAKYFVAHGGKKLSPLDVQQFGEKLVSEWQCKKAAAKTHFKPSEIKLLPIQPIFRNEVYCSDCLYKTKVRTNMFRHLQMHISSNASNGGAQLHVASVDPVNPVPCLNSNERHFDKMCNLASSSGVIGTTTINVAKPAYKPPYVYVPDWRRFTCGVPACQYLTLSDDMFRSHLSALHQNVQQYYCPFCKEELCTRSLTIERILQHLRFHGTKLYQCEECDYLHYMKNVVERHINERHALLRVNLITHERSIEDSAEGTRSLQSITGKKFKEHLTAKPATQVENTNQAANSVLTDATSSATANDPKLKWECDLCKHRTITHNQMIHHCNIKHSCKHQYQCVHCQFGSTQLAHIMTHVDDKHPTKTREARYIFHKIFSSAQEREADTRPLWQRDDPTRVRHIRGILMEDEEESEQYRKRLCLDQMDDDEEFEEFVTITDKPNTDSFDKTTSSGGSDLKCYKYACYHCDFGTFNFNELRNKHWQTTHNSVEHTAKPFYFRLLAILKCAECKQFTGDHNELQLHMQNAHKTRIFIAADADKWKQLICGYCDFSYMCTDQLFKHFQHLAHKPHDLKSFQPEDLATISKLGRVETFVQCMLCTDLFANRMSIVDHARTNHAGEASFAFKELQNEIIYRCAICSYCSTDELTTLRHMVDHYGAFKHCVFCRQSQTTFNGYMQHCYTEHRSDITLFSKIYTLHEISKFLKNIFLIFPNGLMINKNNLSATQHGSNKLIGTIYKEICKTSIEPPIPRLSIASLVARKSIEAKATRNGSPNPDEHDVEQQRLANINAALQQASDIVSKQAKKISKRRKTVAFDSRSDFKAPEFLFNSADDNFLVPKKKRKTSENTFMMPTTSSESVKVIPESFEKQPYSFYGKKTEPMDLSKVYTKVAIGGLDTPLTIDKFKMLFKIDAHVVVEKLNDDQIRKKQSGETPRGTYEEYQHVKKACPASHKCKYV